MNTIQDEKNVKNIQNRKIFSTLKPIEYYLSALHKQLELLDQKTLNLLTKKISIKPPDSLEQLRDLPSTISQHSLDVLQEICILKVLLAKLQEKFECQKKILTQSMCQQLQESLENNLTHASIEFYPFSQGYVVKQHHQHDEAINQNFNIFIYAVVGCFFKEKELINDNSTNKFSLNSHLVRRELEKRWFTSQFINDLPKVLSLLSSGSPPELIMNQLAKRLANSSITKVGVLH